MQAVYKTYDKK